MRRLVLVAGVALVAAVFASPASGAAGRISVGLTPDVTPEDVAAALEAATDGDVTSDLGPLDALVLAVPDVDGALAAASAVPGVDYAEPVEVSRTLAFTPDDPYAGGQWYLSSIRAFDHWAAWVEPPPLPPVRVAVIDSGIDSTHPEFLGGRIAEARNFISSDPAATADTVGHGTMVAGEIAAAVDNAVGIAGVGIPVELLVAKVVGPNGGISLLNEARAIRWAVDRGATVINLSIGGPRDPRDPFRDSYSELERSAIDYATRNGVVVVAAGGNCVDICPDPYVGYPAALPHVVGVSAIAPDNSTPRFSNRDRYHNDFAAPGTEMLSTYPLAYSPAAPDCTRPGYTDCAVRSGHRSPSGTSFSAPLASAAAALLQAERGRLGLRSLHASQVTLMIERAAVDIGAPGRDRFSGRGRLDVARALSALGRALPARDRLETNDDAGARARSLWGLNRTVKATLTRYDDIRDVYRVYLRAGRRAVFRVAGLADADLKLVLWRPGTRRITGAERRWANRLAATDTPSSRERLVYRASRSGWYFLEVRLVAGRAGLYRLAIAKP